MSDKAFMQQAIALAERGRFTTTPNPNVGCVVVKEGVVVGQGWHQKAGEPHAEVHALRQAGTRAKGATAYVTLEPCSHHGRTPPCCDALIAAGVKRVVVAMPDPNPQVAGRGLHRLQQAGIRVEQGLLADAAERLNCGFLKRMRTGLPWVQLKMACSLDGKTAMASGESQWITSPQARQDVQYFRAQSSAILTTSQTVLADDPAMTVRWDELSSEVQAVIGEAALLRQPTRIVLDSAQRVGEQAKIFATPGEVWQFSASHPEINPAWSRRFMLPEHGGGLDLVALMMTLGQQQINQLWVEAGATLAGALLTAGVVDELFLYIAPKLLGSDAQGLCVLPGITQLAAAPRFSFEEVAKVGPDLRVVLRPE